MHRTEHADGMLDGTERWTVPLSLGGSFLANDGEELVTMARTSGLPPTHVRVGVGVMGVLIGAAVLDGIRIRGRGRLYQDAQLVFGAHGLGHIGGSLLTGRYTPASPPPPRWCCRSGGGPPGDSVLPPCRGRLASPGPW